MEVGIWVDHEKIEHDEVHNSCEYCNRDSVEPAKPTNVMWRRFGIEVFREISRSYNGQSDAR
jgi:hypothetical protein